MTLEHQVALRRAFAATAVSIFLVVASACDSTPNPGGPGSAQVDPLPGEQYPKIEAAEGLSRYLAFSGLKEYHATDTKPMWLTVAVRAMTQHQELNIQYRFFFFDKDNVPLKTEPDWQFARLPSRSQVFLQGHAMDRNAVDWRLQIRPAR